MTPIDPIEAVARATRLASDCSDPYETYAAHWQNIARAALTALRDCGVTEGMVHAAVVTSSMCDPREREEIAAEFRAMLDAALGE